MVLPSFGCAAAALAQAGPIVQLTWVAILVVFFVFVEIRVLCSHCPHYAEDSRVLRCWANYGMPKVWPYRPGPMTWVEKAVLFAGFGAVWGTPLAVMVLHRRWFLFAVGAATTVGFFVLLGQVQCRRCINLACPLNRVPEPLRRDLASRLGYPV